MLNILSALCLITRLIPVYVSTPKGNSVGAYHLTEMSSTEYNRCLEVDSYFNTDIRISTPTSKYNCH